ncbi:tRNA 4-thiouridine(8) synthase ThiI, partial [Candidatus Omnitrophota bacterium]
MKKKSIALISGGLDSLLAAKTIMKQGIEVLGVVFVMQFASRNVQRFMERVREATGDAGIPVRFIDISKEFLEVLKSPRHGYGAHLNPCIDCKILMLRRAKKVMQEEGASFVITGEVLGERPMSQRKDALEMIKKESSLGDKLLRPLSARLLEATLPEKEG